MWAHPLLLDAETRHNLEDGLILFFTGFSRSASSILRKQEVRSRAADPAMIASLHATKELAMRSKAALESNQLDEFGLLMHEHWTRKKTGPGTCPIRKSTLDMIWPC